MNRYRLATLTSLLAATLAHADIPVEDRPLTAASAPRPATAVPVVAATGAGAAPVAAAAPAAAPAGSAWEQYTQVEQLQQQIQQLQGLIEQQGFLIEKMQNDLRVRYTDLDQRLAAQQDLINALQSAAQSAPPALPGAATGPAGAPGTAPAAPASATLEDEKRAYLAAYDTFRVGGPDKAIPPMLAFVKRYPNSTFVPSAYYWLGEFYLNASTPDQAAAQKQFDIVLSNYPSSPKAAAALYKTGAILDLRGKPLEAKKRMQELLEKYPKSPEASLAQSYLDALETAGKPAEEAPKAKDKPTPPQSAKDKAAAGKSAKTAKSSKDKGKAKAATQTSSRKKN